MFQIRGVSMASQCVAVPDVLNWGGCVNCGHPQTILNITSISITTVILLHLWQVAGNLDRSSFDNLACSWSYSNVPKLQHALPDHFFLCIKGPLKLSNDLIPSANFLHGRLDSLHMQLWARSNICHETKSFKWQREDWLNAIHPASFDASCEYKHSQS